MDKKVFTRIIIIIVTVAMIGTVGISFLGKSLGGKKQSQAEEKGKIQRDDQYNDVRKGLKGEKSVVNSEVYDYDNKVIGTVVVDENATQEEINNMVSKYEGQIKEKSGEKPVVIKVVDKKGNEVNNVPSGENALPKATVTMIDTKIPLKTYLQVKLDTDKPENYKIVVNGTELEMFTMQGTNEILFDGTLQGTYVVEELVPVVFNK